MISFLRELAALPFKLIYWVCHFLHLKTTPKAASLIWKISRESIWANTWVMLVCQQEGLEKARQLAGQLLEKYKDASMAHNIGNIELMLLKDPAAADKWIRMAETAGCQNMENLLYLKLVLAEHIVRYNPQQIIEELLSRNDMSMEYSRAARLAQAEMWLRKGQWQNADEILDTMLKVENVPAAYVFKWVTLLAQGQSKQAEENLSIAIKSLGAPRSLFYQALGWFYLGQEDQAKTFLERAIQGGIDVKDVFLSQPQLAALIPTSTAARSFPAGGQA